MELRFSNFEGLRLGLADWVGARRIGGRNGDGPLVLGWVTRFDCQTTAGAASPVWEAARCRFYAENGEVAWAFFRPLARE